MDESGASASHRFIAFSTDSSLLVITPRHIDAEGMDGNPAIYSEVTYDFPWCKGHVFDVFGPSELRDLKVALARMRNGESASSRMPGWDGHFGLEVSWNIDQQVALIGASMGSWLSSEDWCNHFRKVSPSCYGKCYAFIGLTLCMEAAALDEPLAELEAVLEYIRLLRSTLPGPPMDNSDIEDIG